MISQISTKIVFLRSHVPINMINTLKLLCNAIEVPHIDYSDMVNDAVSETNKIPA